MQAEKLAYNLHIRVTNSENYNAPTWEVTLHNESRPSLLHNNWTMTTVFMVIAYQTINAELMPIAY